MHSIGQTIEVTDRMFVDLRPIRYHSRYPCHTNSPDRHSAESEMNRRISFRSEDHTL